MTWDLRPSTLLAMAWEKVKSFLSWVYEWITVLTSAVVGFLAFVPDILSSIDLAHLGVLLTTEKATMIVAIVGLLKGTIAAVRAKVAK